MKLKNNSGFSLIEAMTVVVILAVLFAIAIPNYINAQDRAKYANLKLNMTIVRTSVEIYALDWGGAYAANKTELYNEGKSKKYLRDFKNPFTNSATTIKDVGDIQTDSDLEAGLIVYGSSGSGTSPIVNYFSPPDSTRIYVIYSIDKDLLPFKEKGSIFYLSNG